MSGNQRPMASLTFKIGEQNHSAISVWRGKHPGQYSISRDKGSDKYPGIATFREFLTMCSSVWGGNGFLNLRVDSESQPRDQSGYDRPRGNGTGGPSGDDFSGGDSFGGGGPIDDEIPFDRVSRGIAQ